MAFDRREELNYTDVPVLSKVKIGDNYYYLKDADARLAIDSILADYLTSADKTELDGKITALAARVLTIEGDYVTEAELAAAVKEEADRAKAAEEALDGRLDVIEGEGEGSIKKAVADEATARDAAIEAAIEALDVNDAAVDGKYVSAVKEVDGKIEVTRADLPVADQYTLVKQATPDTGDASTYYLTKNGTQEGAKINIPKDQFLKDAKFCAKAEDVPAGHTPPTDLKFPAILFVFTRTAGDEDVWVPVKDLVDVYTAGAAIAITDNEISVKLKSNDPYIEIDGDNQIATKGIDTAISNAVAAEALIARAAEQANATAIAAEVTRATGKEGELATAISAEEARAKAAEEANADAITAIKDGDEIDSFADVEAALALKADDADLDALAGHVTIAEGEIDTLQADMTQAKADITANATAISTEKSRAEGQEAAIRSEFAAADTVINNKIGAKTDAATADTVYGAINAEVDRATAAEEALDNRIDALDAGAFKNVDWVDMGRELTKTIGSTTTVVHSFGALADKDSASGTVEGQTITGVKATGTSTGELTGALGYNATAMASTGKFTATGDIDVTLGGNSFNAITSVGSMPTYTPENVTGGKATVINTAKFNGGTQANFVQGSKATLTAQTTAKFANKVLKPAVDPTDSECLIFNYVDSTEESSAFADAVTDRGTFTANGDDTFTKNTVASLGDGFYTAGSDVSYTASQWTDGVTPTMAAQTVTVASKSFTGTPNQDISVSGNYDKANLGTVAFAGKDIELAVGTITVAAKTVTVQ